MSIMDTNNENRSENSLAEGFGEFFNTAEGGGAGAPDASSGNQAPSGRPSRPVVPERDSAGAGNAGDRSGGAYGREPGMAEYREFRDRVNAQASHPGHFPQRSGGMGPTDGGSPNFGLQRKSGRRRVVGGSTSLKTSASGVVKSYKTASGMQFNDVEELRSDAISRAFAQEILEKLWETWGLDTGVPEVMRKAEDVVYALLAMRTASPDADYDVVVALGDSEVNLVDLSRILASEEVTRRRFARAVADDIRAYVSEPDNVKLREMLVTELGVKAEYATLAFDGSTHCSGMSTNQVMFTKQLEQMNLFDTPDVRDRLASNQQLATAGFQVNNKRSAYK